MGFIFSSTVYDKVCGSKAGVAVCRWPLLQQTVVVYFFKKWPF
jgi:hypothetical protein